MPPASPFQVPIQLSASACGGGGLPSVFEYPDDDASDAAATEDFSRVFCSPPRQSFQLLLRGGDDPVLKDDPDPALQSRRRSSSRLAKVAGGCVTASVSMSAAKPKTRSKRAAPYGDAPPTTARGAPGGTFRAGAPLLQQQQQQQGHLQQEEEQQQKKRPKRKASYLARKEEKEALTQHIEELKEQLATLKQGMVTSNGAGVLKQMHNRHANDVLADAIKRQQLTIAGLRAMLSEHSTLQTRNPTEMLICLSSDRQERDETLLRLKRGKLQEAKTFLAERSRGIDPTKRYSDEELYESPDGDLCTLRFDIFPLRGAKSVRAVFDAMVYYIENIEITISETMGYITIREDDDSSDAHVSQHRLVMSISPSIQVESNSVTFSEFSTEGLDTDVAGLGCGVVASSFVDEDELYPYQPQSRVRREVSAMMMVSPHMIKTKKKRATATSVNDEGEGNEEEEEELVVSLRRYALTTMRRTDLPIPSSTLEEIRDYYSRFSNELAKVMRANAPNLGSTVL